MDRQTFIGLLVCGILVAPFALNAQQASKVARVGYLRRTSPQLADIAALRQGMRELGYVERQNLIIEEDPHASGPAVSRAAAGASA